MNTTTTPKMRDQGTLTKFKLAWVSKSNEKYVSHLELLLVLGSLSSISGRGSIEKNLIQSAKGAFTGNNSKLSDATKEKLVSMCDIATTVEKLKKLSDAFLITQLVLTALGKILNAM